MKPQQRWTVFRTPHCWQIGRLSGDGPLLDQITAETDKQAFDQIAEHLRQQGYAGDGVLLGLPSSMCLAVSLSPEAMPSGDRRALAYAMEEFLPLAAEECVAASVGPPGRALGVAVAIAPVSQWIDALESRGVRIQSVCPTALLAFQQECAGRSRGSSLVALWHEQETVEILLLEEGLPLRWLIAAADSVALCRALGALTVGRDAPVAAVGLNLPAALIGAAGACPCIEITTDDAEPVPLAAIRAADAALAGAANPWIELRADALAATDAYRPIRGSLRFALAGVAALLLSLTAAMLFRAHQYRSAAHRAFDDQDRIFQAAFPGQPVPRGVLSRLQSEYGKLAVSKRGAPGLSKKASALPSLYRLLLALPDDLKYRFSEIRLEGDRLFFDGDVLSHGDTDRLASALSIQGFEVEPPHSQQAPDQTVSVRLSARTAQPAAAGGKTR